MRRWRRVLLPGYAGSKTAADHLTVLDRALAQLPDRWAGAPILVRAAGAGASQALIADITGRGWLFSSGSPSPRRSAAP